jgi:hypothetical protein
MVQETVPFPFPSKLALGLQYVDGTNKLSKVISCLKSYIFHVNFWHLRHTKYSSEFSFTPLDTEEMQGRVWEGRWKEYITAVGVV